MSFWSLYLPEAASTKEVSLFILIAFLNVSSSVLMYEFFLVIFLNNLSLVFSGSFLAYSTIVFLFSCWLGDSPNATLCIALYLWLKNVTSGS